MKPDTTNKIYYLHYRPINFNVRSVCCTVAKAVFFIFVYTLSPLPPSRHSSSPIFLSPNNPLAVPADHLVAFLEAKASKCMHHVCIEKITWPPLIDTSTLKIVPLVVRVLVYTVGFVKCFDILYFSILFYFESVRSIENQRKNNNILLV